MKNKIIVIGLCMIIMLAYACGKKNPAGPSQATPTSAVNSATATPSRTQTAVCSATSTNTITATPSVSPTAGMHLVISQVYVHGGESAGAMEYDFVEIFNPTYYPIMLSGYTLQFGTGSGSVWQVAAYLSGVIQPGSFHLIRMGTDGGGGTALPYPDDSSAFNLESNFGKIALVAGSAPLSSGTCQSGPYVDLLGYGGANCYEGNDSFCCSDLYYSIIRLNSGSLDTDQNGDDFTIAAPNPRNSGNPYTFTYTGTATHTPYQSPTYTPTCTFTKTGTPTATPTVPHLVISQIYRNGGQDPSGFDCDYVEIYNPYGVSLNMSGYTLQFANPGSVAWQIIANLNADVGPGEYHLVQLFVNPGTGDPLPVSADTTGSFNLPDGGGKLALVAGNSQLTTGHCPAQKVDFVGYEGTTCFEGTDYAFYPDDFTTALIRLNNGRQDTDDNMNDFTVNLPNPRHQGHTPTITPTYTVTRTHTDSPTFTPTLTITETSTITNTPTQVNHLVISQVYKSGPGGTYDHSFVEIHNPTDSDVVMMDYSLHIAEGPAGDYVKLTLNGTVTARGYYLIHCGGPMNGAPLPAPDAITALDLSNVGTGRIAIASDNIPIPPGIKCPGASKLDLLGYGFSVACSEGTPAGDYMGDTTAMMRLGGGDTDSENNNADFYLAAPNPRNSGWSPSATMTPTCTQTTQPTYTPTPWVVISQLYGGGGLSAAIYTNDYVELFNKSDYSVSLNGWSLQYASSGGTGWGTSKFNLSGNIAPNSYFLIQLASGGINGMILPSPDLSTGSLNLASMQGKIALVRTVTGLPAVACPLPDVSIADLVGYGATSTCNEGGIGRTAPALSSTLAGFRTDSGCGDTDDNMSDFFTAGPAPRNSSSSQYLCP